MKDAVVPETCTIEGCDLPYLAQGRCRKHYAAGRRSGEIQVLPREHLHSLSALDRESASAYCSACQRVVPVVGLNFDRPQCAIKSREARKAAYQRNLEKRRAYSRDYARRSRHRIKELGGVEALLAAQDHACAICSKAINVRTARVDHDHECCPGRQSCGRCIRGLLCNSCNTGLGLLGDNSDALARALAYLRRGAMKPIPEDRAS